jgi:hypothetical protein
MTTIPREPIMPDNDDPHARIREKVAVEHRFQLYRRYSERDAAERIGFDYSTLKRKRRAGLIPFVDLGGGSVGYMGYHIADIILLGVNAKHHQDANAETLTCGNPPCQIHQASIPAR